MTELARRLAEETPPGEGGGQRSGRPRGREYNRPAERGGAAVPSETANALAVVAAARGAVSPFPPPPSPQCKEIGVKTCGACSRMLPDDVYSEKQRGMRQSSRRCEVCVAAGNELVLMKEGLTFLEEDDCPICQLPLPHDVDEVMLKECCMKAVCNGCILAARKRGMLDCPFCRTSQPKTNIQALIMIQKRVDAGDPVAMFHLGAKHENARYGLEKDVMRAIELRGERHGQGSQALRGSSDERRCFPRYNLGCVEKDAGNHDLALQHRMISAAMGHDDSLTAVKTFLMAGLATKADYAAALRGFQMATDGMSSSNRDEAKALRERNGS
ncbi:hypothetical protein THAOC_17993 [Thalassiosira oceanica]|uniref:RING-type domain-containing protein n=1 Tax=Thalassiosira oceanica TaxID=159749 RepID=K0S875_THAOC|nr:hypothetical protein THAOC_17993 [Thalassiosira oceanica]|eukprot:EJK61505.1 hypothetical protein THAOC_17993 [Thalassiosira oceanica]